MRGKNKCKILKEIRRRIAVENDIPYVTSECKFQGECRGTCPKCEQELRDLEQQLERRQRLGKAISVSALTAGLLINAVGCPAPSPSEPLGGETETETVEQLIGEVTVPSDVIEGGIGEPMPDNTDDVTKRTIIINSEWLEENRELYEDLFGSETTIAGKVPAYGSNDDVQIVTVDPSWFDEIGNSIPPEEIPVLGMLPIASEYDDRELTGDFAIVEETTENNG